MVLLLLCSYLSSFAQLINLQLKNVTVKQAIETIQKQNGYSFAFATNDLNTKKIVTVLAKDLPIEKVVEQVLAGQDVSYTIQGKDIIIKKKSGQSAQQSSRKYTISGIVKDMSGEPVIGANIKEKNGTAGTISGMDGTFQSPFNPLKWGDAFTEGNSWHYTWSVFHDPQGLIDLMGGKDGFNQMMDSVFILPPIFDESYYGAVIHEIREMQIMNMGNYAHGNQPIQHMLYMYNYSGQPWKAQHWIREVMDKLYTPAPDGYCGDEDNGQTSAWYVFSAMGFYPVCPGTDEYVLGTPYFKEMKLHLENGKTVTISAPNNGDDKRYISSMKLNGKEYTKNYLTHQDLLNGASISFKMDAKPNQQRGTKEVDFPYSFSNEFKKKK